MNRGIYTLVGAQFLSAFADNPVLFTVIAMVLREGGRGTWYAPARQSVFLLAFVSPGPWVGSLSDRLPKPRVLILANLAKAAGGLAMLLGVEPLVGCGVIGGGGGVQPGQVRDPAGTDRGRELGEGQ